MSLSEYSVIKRDFNGNRSALCNFMSDIEYSVITSDILKSFDCITSRTHFLAYILIEKGFGKISLVEEAERK